MAEGWRKLRVGYRCGRALGSLVLVLMLSVPWRLAGRWRTSRRAIENAAWDILLRGFGIRVRCHGDRRLAPGTLVLANHLSWVDIAVLARVADVGFVAKADVAGWPLLGVLAQRHGSVFVDRHRRAGVVEARGELVVRLASGRSLILFAEGTTSTGEGVMPFHASMVPDATADRGMICPVTLACRDPRQRALVAWVGDDALLPHALALAAAGGATIDVDFGKPLGGGDRKQVVREAQARIALRLADLLGGGAAPTEDQAATLKRAA